jgi:hypothetical protein
MMNQVIKTTEQQKNLNKLRKALRLLSQSADKYIEDGSWIDTLTGDIEHAKQVLKETT